MTDYGHDLLFGTFITPSSADPATVVDLAVLADRSGLDLVTFQDHPYQPALLDASTLLAYVAGRTERIRLAANVANLPLRPPVVLARAAASLDLLSGGRFELGLGAGGFWDAIEAVGGRNLGPGKGVDALREGIGLIREVWDTETRGGIRFEGEHYRAAGAKRGPAPAHDIGIWVGALKPRMLRLVGELADGWVPSLFYLPDGVASLPEMNARIDRAAEGAGRSPAAVRRLLNIGGRFAPTERGHLDGPPSLWVSQLTDLVLEHGVSAPILASDDAGMIQRFAQEVAPAVRAAVARERG